MFARQRIADLFSTADRRIGAGFLRAKNTLSCHSRESGDRVAACKNPVPAFAGMTVSGRFLLSLALSALLLLPLSSARAQSAFDDPGARGTTGGGSGGIVAVNPNTDGGTISMGSAAQIVVLFRNEGARPVTTGTINLYPSSTVSAAIVLNQCAAEPLPGGGQCAIAVSVKGLQPGPWRVEMLMRHDGRSRLVTTTLAGNVEATGDGTKQLVSDVEAIPADLAFGALDASRAIVKSVILRNITSNPIDITSVTVEANAQAGYSSQTDCTKLEAGQACVVTVTWAPLQKGPATGVLVINHTGPTGVVSVSLDGKYTPASVSSATLYPEAVPGQGLLVSSRDQVDFGSGVENKSSVTISLVNSGDAALTLEDIHLSGSENGISVGKKGCEPGTMLEPTQACPLTLTWSPVRTGSIIDDIQVLHSGARGILVIPVRGESTGTVSQDSQSVLLSEMPGLKLKLDDLEDEDTPKTKKKKRSKKAAQEEEYADSSDDDGDFAPIIKDKLRLLDGYQVTSLAPTRAIISGPGGSRVVFNNEETVIGGASWMVFIRHSGVEMHSGEDKLLLLFDRSLSSINRNGGQSTSGKSSTGAGTATTTASASESTTSSTTTGN
ncbi:MAG: choice-of-anchor D domain-containing protein [Rhodospirillales bacterium]|nr:choice-of-anchor D domain-containing protein [Rhodospirillales bacterium]